MTWPIEYTDEFGEWWETLNAFDPRRTAILLIGGCKSGNDRWFEKYIPIADKLYSDHLQNLKADTAKEK